MSISIWIKGLFVAICVFAAPYVRAAANGDTLTTSTVTCTASSGGCYSVTITWIYYNGFWTVLAVEERLIPRSTHAK